MAIQDINNQYLLEDGFDRDYIRDLIENRRIPGGMSSLLGGGTGGTGKTYVSPDTTYSSGFDYARSIAGGIPASQMIQSGVSYSPDMPGGYTQADLNVVNLPRDVAPVFPQIPGTGDVAQPSEPMMPNAPTGTPMPIPLPNFFGGIPKFDPSKLQNFSGIKLFDFDPSQFAQQQAPMMPPMDQPMIQEDGLIPFERPDLNIPPITPNINFEAPVVQKPVMPKQEGLFPTVGRGISAVRGAQEGFDEFKEGLKKKAIKGLFGIG
jgi:hypothetical protein